MYISYAVEIRFLSIIQLILFFLNLVNFKDKENLQVEEKTREHLYSLSTFIDKETDISMVTLAIILRNLHFLKSNHVEIISLLLKLKIDISFLIFRQH